MYECKSFNIHHHVPMLHVNEIFFLHRCDIFINMLFHKKEEESSTSIVRVSKMKVQRPLYNRAHISMSYIIYVSSLNAAVSITFESQGLPLCSHSHFDSLGKYRQHNSMWSHEMNKPQWCTGCQNTLQRYYDIPDKKAFLVSEV